MFLHMDVDGSIPFIDNRIGRTWAVSLLCGTVQLNVLRQSPPTPTSPRKLQHGSNRMSRMYVKV